MSLVGIVSECTGFVGEDGQLLYIYYYINKLLIINYYLHIKQNFPALYYLTR